MIGMLFNNILYCFSDIYIISYLLDFIIGNSITTTFLLYVCSYVFGFCKWHRFIITANIINLLIANLDAYYRIPISDIQLLIVYHFVAALFICISTYIHIKNNHDERKIKDKVAASPRGKELLEKQLNNIKVKKEEIIKEANKNIEVFKRFQEAARLNPNLTYAEFVKSLN